MSKGRFFFPTKRETLASRRQEKIQRWRLNHFGQRLSRFSSLRWVKTGEMGGIVALFLANLWLLWPFFGHEDRANVFSAPVIPVLATATEFLIPFSYGIRLWLLVFLVFFPLSFYFFVKEISGRKLVTFLSNLIVILPVGIFLPIRIALGLFTEDGGHIASLTLTPLVCLALLKFLRRGHFWLGILAALGTALVALTSPIGLMVLGVFMGAMTFSEMLLGEPRLKLMRFLVILILTMGFSAFWYSPKFVLLTIDSSQGQLVRRTLTNLIPLSFFLVPILGVFGFLLFENRPQLQPMFIAFFLTVAFGLFSLGAGVAHPLPSRFLPAFGLSLAFLLGILIVWLLDFFRFSPHLKRFSWIAVRRKLIAFSFMALIFSLTILMIIFFGRGWQTEQTQGLAYLSEQKGGVWVIREKTSRAENILGYLISGLTVFGVVVLRRKVRSEVG